MANDNLSAVFTDRKIRILLGVTGSVAAVKAPELAVRLYRELNADVRVLLTSGGKNFWTKAKDYDGKAWKEFEELRHQSTEEQQHQSGIKVYGKEKEEGLR